MKKTLLILILIFGFQSWTKADDIRDFEIGGISVGDSLLDYMTAEEITKYDQELYNSNSVFFETQYPYSVDSYEYLLFHVKKNDPKYIIYSIRGASIVKNKKNCFKIKKVIVKDMKGLFNNIQPREYEINHYFYKNSKQYITQFDFKNSESIRTECMMMHVKDIEIHGDIPSTLEVVINGLEFKNWINNL